MHVTIIELPPQGLIPHTSYILSITNPNFHDLTSFYVTEEQLLKSKGATIDYVLLAIHIYTNFQNFLRVRDAYTFQSIHTVFTRLEAGASIY